jgi:hypothetical protein
MVRAMFTCNLRMAPVAVAMTLFLSACGGSSGDGSSAAAASSSGSTSTSTSGSTSSSTSTTGSDSSTTTSSGNTQNGGAPNTPVNSSPSTPPVSQAQKSAKRGIAFDLADPADFTALTPGVSWWYNWGSQPNKEVPADWVAQYGMDYYPMLWNGTYNQAAVEAFLQANTNIKYLLVMNEPNLTSQSNLTPSQAAAIWPGYEAIAAHTGVKIVGPQITYGTMTGFTDPVVWMDAFIAAYQSANGGRSPQIDYLGFHWYDYGLSGQLDRLTKYGKPFWVTEFANWHSQNDGAQIDTLAKQEAQMKDMVATCESRSDVARYAWFTGRVTNDVHFDSLLGASGQLTDLGKLYLTLPYMGQ